MKQIRRQIYIDCDGVLADFDKHFKDCFGMEPQLFEEAYGKKEFWQVIQYGTEHFYLNLPLMEGAKQLMDAVIHTRPIILTGCPMGGWAEPQKVEWARSLFLGVPMVTCMSRDKSDYCLPGDVLVDDREHYKDLWEDEGGVFITHKNAFQSISSLKFFNYI